MMMMEVHDPCTDGTASRQTWLHPCKRTDRLELPSLSLAQLYMYISKLNVKICFRQCTHCKVMFLRLDLWIHSESVSFLTSF
jgi:hypothetical protein